MLYRVVRPFPLSLDGLTLIDLNAGDEREDFGGMQDGLAAEGYIEPVGAVAASAVVSETAQSAESDEPASLDLQPAPQRGRKRK